jgi:predicted AAA+ superfamily ATPase
VPWSLEEILHRGFFPPIHDRGLPPTAWLDGYVRTYVERDVRQVSGVGDLDAFSRFLGLCAGRVGGLLNLSSLGADAGVSHVTARRWISILRASYVIDLLQPHFENYRKRIVKSPKLYFVDTGLLCHLLGIRGASDLRVHPLRGMIFENLVLLEHQKLFLNQGVRPPLFFWRDQRGTEVDLLIDLGLERIPLEAKSGETVARDFFAGLDAYTALSHGPGGILVHGGNESEARGPHLLRPWWDCS